MSVRNAADRAVAAPSHSPQRTPGYEGEALTLAPAEDRLGLSDTPVELKGPVTESAWRCGNPVSSGVTEIVVSKTVCSINR